MGRERDVASTRCSVEELTSDLHDLLSVARGMRRTVLERREEVSRCSTIHPATGAEQARLLREQLDGLDTQIEALSNGPGPGAPEGIAVARLQGLKTSHASLLRSRLAAVAGATLASDWNSPSIGHSITSNAGRETGSITSFLDDYKRDRHRLAACYERAWLDEYVDAPSKDGLRALMTSCGMSAFTTIAHFLRSEASSGPLLAGRATYHECRDLLESGIAGRAVIEIDETNPGTVMGAVRELDPSGIVIDSLGNNSTIAFPDLEDLLDRLAGARFRGVVVIDNTGRSVTAQPWAPGLLGRLRMIAFESVTKYAQLGFDRTAAGMIVCSTTDGVVLDDLREHLGTNITDMSVAQLPAPDRSILERRLSRIDRNATAIATALRQHVETRRLPLRVHHASLPDHPSHGIAQRLSFRGGSLAIGLDVAIDNHPARFRLVELALEEARAAGVPLIHGTSFGFDITRIYLTSAHADHGIPFVRVSAGTEHTAQIDAVASVLRTAVSRLTAEFPVSRLPGTSTTRSAYRREPATVRPM